MTENLSAGATGVVVVGGSAAWPVVFVVVVFFGVGFEDADAAPATSAASVIPSENVASVITATATAFLRGVRFFTTFLPSHSHPGSGSLPGAGRGSLRSDCGPPGLRGSRSSPGGRRRAAAARRCRRNEAPPRLRPLRSHPRR